MGSHLVGEQQQFKSDKYEWCPPGFVPLKTTDKDAQPCLWMYAQSHRARDPEFSDDLETALRAVGFKPLAAVPAAKSLGFWLHYDDPLAQDLLWAYAQRRKEEDPAFPLDRVAEDLRAAGYVLPTPNGTIHEAEGCCTPSELQKQAQDVCACSDPSCGVIIRCQSHPEAPVVAKYLKNRHSIIFNCAECDADLTTVHLDERAHAQ